MTNKDVAQNVKWPSTPTAPSPEQRHSPAVSIIPPRAFLANERAVRVELLLAFVVLIWGVNFPNVKAALQQFAPLTFNALRFILAASVLWLAAWRRGVDMRLTWQEVRQYSVLGKELLFFFGLTLLAGSSPGLGAIVQAEEDSAQTLVLHHISVVDARAGTIQTDMAVAIRGGRIEMIAPASQYQPPRDAKVIDLSGHYVTPGFIEMHAHLLLHPWDAKGNIMPRYDRNAVLTTLRTLLAFGITTVRDPGAPTEAALTFRDLLAREKIIGPRILTAGRILNSSSFDAEPFAVVTTVPQVRDEIAWQAAAGVDFVKVYSNMPPDLLEAVIAAAHSRGLRVIGHLQRTTWTQAAALGIDALCHAAPWSPEYLPESQRGAYQQTLFGRVYWLEHLDLQSPAVEALIAALVKHRVALDPTLIAMHSKFWGNDPRYVQHPQIKLAPEVFRRGWPRGSFTAGWSTAQYQSAQAQWPKLLAFTKLLHDRGVLLTVGTDTPTPWIIPGVSYHEELRLCAEAGIPAKDLLRMATRNAAEALGRENEIGTIAPGKLADLVVLRDNPLDNIKNMQNIALVIKAGKVYDPRLLLRQND